MISSITVEGRDYKIKKIPFYSIVGAALSTDVGFKLDVFYHPEIPHGVLLVYMGDYTLAKPHSHGNAKSEKKKNENFVPTNNSTKERLKNSQGFPSNEYRKELLMGSTNLF